MRLLILISLLVTATFQGCDGSGIGRPNSPGNGQGYEGVKPDPDFDPGDIVYVPPAGAGDAYGIKGNCEDISRYESVILFTKRGYELIADNCVEVIPALKIEEDQLTVLQGPPIALIFNKRIYPKVSR